MLKAIRATLLILTLSCVVYAGDMQNGVQPTPTPTVETQTTGEPAEYTVGDPQQSAVTTTEITLNLVQLVLALF